MRWGSSKIPFGKQVGPVSATIKKREKSTRRKDQGRRKNQRGRKFRRTYRLENHLQKKNRRWGGRARVSLRLSRPESKARKGNLVADAKCIWEQSTRKGGRGQSAPGESVVAVQSGNITKEPTNTKAGSRKIRKQGSSGASEVKRSRPGPNKRKASMLGEIEPSRTPAGAYYNAGQHGIRRVKIKKRSLLCRSRLGKASDGSSPYPSTHWNLDVADSGHGGAGGLLSRGDALVEPVKLPI